ncbi:transcriptional regulator, AraC family [Nannocystis exedens]|uniref:Transcriptional regulator, AraC family n=1 Tax=Nannocystis exedens TaxID=54 RepID=A0A1I2EHH5_9BACT|nr:helix-turn-helix transcriptional regulator [Nannocystis exedens]PCC74739.1 AraC family transcriptional regulator [Nannocystis exedens]SFE91710.1 transcriptional regulator, AraC family [Nannocystis exedens]
MLPTLDAAAATFSLSRFVEDVHVLVPLAGRARYERLPDGRTTLVFRVLEEGQRGDVCLVGPRMRALFKDTTGIARAIVLQFKPGWSTPLFGVAAHALADRIVRLEDIWGRPGSELCLDLLTTRSLPEVVDRVSRAIAVRAHHTVEPSSARLARRAVHLFEAGEARVEGVAERLGVTARHLRRAFTESVGIGPKDFARTVRLRRAVRMSATSKDWARIAADAGYYDQAHLIADFRELVGLTPASFLKRAGERRVRSAGEAQVAPRA